MTGPDHHSLAGEARGGCARGSMPAAPPPGGSVTSIVDAVAGIALSEASSSGSLEQQLAEEAAAAERQQSAQPPAGSPQGGGSCGAWRPTPADAAACATAPLLVAAHPGLPYQKILSGDPRNLPVNTDRCVLTGVRRRLYTRVGIGTFNPSHHNSLSV